MFGWSTKGRADYELFLANHPPCEFPIEFNLEAANASKLRRQAQEANVTEQRRDIPPSTEAPYQANFYEQADHVPTEHPPDSSHLQVHRAEAILRASTNDVPAGGNSIFRLLSDPSRFAAYSTNTTNKGVRSVKEQEAYHTR